MLFAVMATFTAIGVRSEGFMRPPKGGWLRILLTLAIPGIIELGERRAGDLAG
jgi:hypothetical protein